MGRRFCLDRQWDGDSVSIIDINNKKEGAKEKGRIIMPRKARKDLESNYLHIIVQGINREYIFQDNKLKQAYKCIIKNNIKDTSINILAYCIMDNHVHLLMHGDCIKDISKVMQKSNTSYAKMYNKLNKRVGYVFRDRYYSQMILSENQLFNCLVYIHKNPLKANIVKEINEYPYSSYIEYKGKKELIANDGIKLMFGSSTDYMLTFNLIHKKENIDDIMDDKEDSKSSDAIIYNFIKIENKTIKEIKNEEKTLARLLIKLREDGGFSLREMSDIFQLNKDKLAKIINRNIE